MSRWQTNLDCVPCSGGSVVILKPFAQCVGRDSNDCIHLRVKIRWTPKRLHSNAVLLNVVNRSLEVFFADKAQESNQIVGPAEHAGGQNRFQFSPLSLKLVDRGWQIVLSQWPLEGFDQ